MDQHPRSVIKYSFMVNPFKPDDKVLILRKGIEIEATVRTTFNHEVQVRTADGELLWRTVKTIRSVIAPEPEQPADTPEGSESHSVVAPADPPEDEPAMESPPVCVDSPASEEVVTAEPASEEAAPCNVDNQSLDQPAEPEPQKPEKGSRKSRKRGKGFLSKFLADDSYDQ